MVIRSPDPGHTRKQAYTPQNVFPPLALPGPRPLGNHPPYYLYFDTDVTSYLFTTVPIVGPPLSWTPGNYPGVCTAYQGRLITASTHEAPDTVWCSRPGVWADFTAGITAGDGFNFTSIYRSGIEWMDGQKDLIIGSRGFEYIADAEAGILYAGDIDVRLHSTHGGINVQPAGFGQSVVFLASYT